MRYLLTLYSTAGGKKDTEAFEVVTDRPIRNMQDAEELKLTIDGWKSYGKIDVRSAKVIAFSRFED